MFFNLISTARIAAQFHFETWTTEQGLPYKTVNSVLQTKDGYVWAATGDGLARFDGVRFTIFNTTNTKNLPTNRLGNLVETSDDSLWMSGENRGLVRYKDGAFKNYTIADGLPGDEVSALVFIPKENLLRVVTNKGAARFDGERFAEDFADLPPDEKKQMQLDNTGAILIRRGETIGRLTNETEEILQIPKSLLRFPFHAPLKDRAGNLWLAATTGTENEGYVVRFRDGGANADVFSVEDGLPGGNTNAIFEDSKGNIWFGGRNGGLSIYADGKFRLLTMNNRVPSGGFHEFTEDREGGVWAATDANGLARISTQIINTLSTADGLTGDNVYPLMETEDGAIWIGAWLGKGLDKYENGKFKSVPSRGNLYTSLFQDRAGTIWVGSHNFIGKIKEGKFKTVAEAPQRVFRAITEDRAGAIWFGDEGGELRRVFDSDKEPEIFTSRDSGSLPGGIYNLHVDRSGILWIGTSGGLVKYENERFTVFTEADGLSGNYVRSIYEDSDGTLWFGTFDNGITRLKDGKFSAIRAADGLHDNGAFQILEDDFGRFWMSSNRGIYRVNRQELNDFADGKTNSVTSVAYGLKDGMLDAECNGGVQPAGFKSKRDGTLWFPTQKGVAVINPARLAASSQPPNAVVENCLLDRQKVACSDIKISPENYSLEIEYTGLSFTKPEQIRFRYKLEGLDADWIDAGTRRIANFTHLPPGDYVFKVSAANAGGVWNEATSAGIKISVVPPFYRTLWFLAASLIGAFALVAFAFNRRVRGLERARAAQEEFSRKLLESQERERQRIAAELHDSLGQELLIIKNRALIGLQNGGGNGKTREQLGEISETASAAIEEVREIAYNLRPYHLDDLGLTKAVESMLQRVSAAASTIDFTLEVDSIDGFFSQEAEINFYRIVQESVNNVVKHSGATEADVRIKRSGAELRLSVWDNGKGFDTNLLTEKKAAQNGFGLAGIRERAKILGGRLSISSVFGEGTNVNLTISNSDKRL